MAPAFSKLMSTSDDIVKYLNKMEKVFPPPLTFREVYLFMQTKSDSWNGSDKQSNDSEGKKKKPFSKFSRIEIEVPFDPFEKKGKTYKMEIPIFETGTALEWCIWREKVDDIFTKLGYDPVDTNTEEEAKKKIDKKVQLFTSIMTGEALHEFNQHYLEAINEAIGEEGEMETDEPSRSPQNVLSEALQRTARKFIPVIAGKNLGPVEMQTHYIRCGLYLTRTMDPTVFVAVLKKLNKCQQYLPTSTNWDTVTVLKEKELLSALANAVRLTRIDFMINMMSSQINPFAFDTLETATHHYHRMFLAEQLKDNVEEKANKRKKRDALQTPKDRKKDLPKCTYEPCGKYGHTEDECRMKKRHKETGNNSSDYKKKNIKKAYTADDVGHLFTALLSSAAKGKKTKKRKVSFEANNYSKKNSDALMNHMKVLGITEAGSDSDSDSTSSE